MNFNYIHHIYLIIAVFVQVAKVRKLVMAKTLTIRKFKGNGYQGGGKPNFVECIFAMLCKLTATPASFLRIFLFLQSILLNTFYYQHHLYLNHPSISFQSSFEYIRKQYKLAMANSSG